MAVMFKVKNWFTYVGANGYAVIKNLLLCRPKAKGLIGATRQLKDVSNVGTSDSGCMDAYYDLRIGRLGCKPNMQSDAGFCLRGCSASRLSK